MVTWSVEYKLIHTIHTSRIIQLALQYAWQEFIDTDSQTRCIIVINFGVELGDGSDKQAFHNLAEYDQMKITIQAILTENPNLLIL